jgi:hypothetical protein
MSGESGWIFSIAEQLFDGLIFMQAPKKSHPALGWLYDNKYLRE